MEQHPIDHVIMTYNIDFVMSTENGNDDAEFKIHGDHVTAEAEEEDDDGQDATTDQLTNKQLHSTPLDISNTTSTPTIGRIFQQTADGIHPVQNQHEENDTGLEKEEAATWHDVLVACCCHTGSDWMKISLAILFLLVLLYFFLLGLELLGTSFKVVGGCTAGSLLGSDANPLTGVMIGIIATAILQSSSTTTSIIVSLVSGGLEVSNGIYMIFGCNVGTTVTTMLVSIAHMGDGEELERAFSGSAVFWAFNFLTLLVLLPVEITTQYLYWLTKAMLPSSVEGDSWEGPVKKMVSPLGNTIIMANNALIEKISTGEVTSCSESYPVHCEGLVSYETCEAGLIGCNKKTNLCPAFFQEGANKEDDMVSGWVCLIIALFLLILCLVGLVMLLRKLLINTSTRIIYKATNINPYIAMMIGCGVTVLVQSSSITTSALIPLAGIGVLPLENMYPLVIGADIGTAFTALMAAMVSSSVGSLQIALVHLFFNVNGALMWYPIPFLRKIPLAIARKLGKATRAWRQFPLVFIILIYFVLPLLLVGISTCFEKQSKGFTALGVFLLLLIVGCSVYFVWWWKWNDGKWKCQSCIHRRQRQTAAVHGLADDLDYLRADMEYVKNEILHLKDFPAMIRVEEGRPLAQMQTDEEVLEQIGNLEEVASLYHSCQSKPWQDVILMPPHNHIRTSLNELDLGISHRSARRALASSVRSSRRSLGYSNRSSQRGLKTTSKQSDGISK